MIILIAGASHTGKTALAQKFLEKYHFPYLSIDHLKMGLLRSGHSQLTAYSGDEELTRLLWPIVREIIKTAIENAQNLVIEGCYIPVDWDKDFEEKYLTAIKGIRLVMSESYIRSHFEDIQAHANIIENRIDDAYCSQEFLLAENQRQLAQCQKHGAEYFYIDTSYDLDSVLNSISIS